MWVFLSVAVCACCRRQLWVAQLPKLEGLIHLSHASLGNAGSLIKDWIFHGGFGILPATCSLFLFHSLHLPLSSVLPHFLSLFPLVFLFPRSDFISSHYSISPLSIILCCFSPSVSLCQCLTVSHFHASPPSSSLLFTLRACTYPVVPLNRQIWNFLQWLGRWDTDSTVTNKEQFISFIVSLYPSWTSCFLDRLVD